MDLFRSALNELDKLLEGDSDYLDALVVRTRILSHLDPAQTIAIIRLHERSNAKKAQLHAKVDATCQAARAGNFALAEQLRMEIDSHYGIVEVGAIARQRTAVSVSTASHLGRGLCGNVTVKKALDEYTEKILHWYEDLDPDLYDENVLCEAHKFATGTSLCLRQLGRYDPAFALRAKFCPILEPDQCGRPYLLGREAQR